MARPIINRIQPFDARYDYEINISWIGNRACANRVIIRDNEENGIVWDDTVTTYSLKHTIPANTLMNGQKYVIEVQIYDEENIPSSLSEKVLFYTFTTPDFYFENIPTVINNASLSASVYYYSSDFENISLYNFYLYDSSRKVLIESKVLHDDTDISYIYRGLENNTKYYIRCAGVTVNGMPLDTGYIEINVKYENPNTYARIYTTAIPEQGCVQIASNLIMIQYNGTESFEYQDGLIDLTDKTLYYNEGFLVDGDFTLLLRGINLWQNADILKMSNGQHGLTLSSHIYHDDTLRFRLIVPNGVCNYLIYSDAQVFDNADMITVAIRRKNNVYQLKVFVEIGFNGEGNMWYGTQRPITGLGKYDSWVDVDGKTIVVDKNNCVTYLDDAEPVSAVLHDLWFGGD